MKKILPIVLLFVITSCASQVSFLQEYKGKYRLMLIFAKNESRIKPLQPDLDKYRIPLNKRDILRLYLYENGQSWFEKRPISSNHSFAIRKYYGVFDNITTVVLIGKDGTEIMRQNSDIDFKELIAAIDRMPIRIREMREGN